MPSEITTSVIQTSFRDLEADIGGGMTTCHTLIERSKGFNQRKMNFVLTVAGVSKELQYKHWEQQLQQHQRQP